MSQITFERKGKIALFTLNRPEKHNALTPDLLRELEAAMFEFMEDPELYVGIITGAGQKAFCAGADIKEMLPFTRATKDCPWKAPTSIMRGQYVTKPLIAAVNGVAFGGGGELALACDIRIASENASFRWPEPSLGIMPRLGGTQRLPRLVGYNRAMSILLTNEKVDAQKALQIGLVEQVVPQEQLMDAAMEVANKICALAPLAVRGIKRAVRYGIEMDMEDGLDLENRLAMPLFDTEDYAEGRAAFAETRTPEFKGK